MSRVSAAIVLVLASVVTVACADNILKERPSARATRASTLKPTFSAAGAARGESSVCGAYRRQLRVVRLRQQTASGQAVAGELKSKELSLNAIIADACE